MSLSFAITTRGPAGRVRALLEMVRPHVDEVVLAVDRDGDADVLDACADLADKRLRFELRDSPARLVGWVMHQCSGDWILRLDDDEVPSPALLAALPELMAERHLSCVAFHRRWLFESAERWIDAAPWRSDFQTRLVRNVPGLWSFEGLVHTDGDVVGEKRYSALPMYHCDLLLTSLEARRSKSLRYEAEAPGIVWDGYPLNIIYQPEQHDDLTLARVPAADQAAARAILDAGPVSATPPAAGAPVRDFDFGEVDRFNSSARASEVALRGEVEWVSPPHDLPAGALVHQDVRVRNLGHALWRRGGLGPAFLVSLRCREVVTGKLVSEQLEPFTETVWPGQESVLLVGIRTPPEPGEYQLELDLWHDRRTFGDCPRRRVSVFGVPDASANGMSDTVIDAQDAAQSVSRNERLRREYEAAAAQLQGTRRYRLLDALSRPVGRRPPGEERG